MSDRSLAAHLDHMLSITVGADPGSRAALDERARLLGAMMTEAGLDPADQDQRRAFALGWCAGSVRWGGSLAVAAAVRPPVAP